jgi:hypothetical protein
VPRLIAQFEHEGCLVVMQTAGAGNAAGNRFVRGCWQFLSRLMLDRAINLNGHVFEREQFPRRVAALHGRAASLLSRALQSLRGGAGREYRAAVVHGDFAPWNVRLVRQSPQAAAFVFDWEFGRESGLPLSDALHFIVQTDVLVQRRPPKEILRHINALMDAPDARAYQRAAGIEREDLIPLLLAYLIDAIVCGFESVPQISDLQRARLDLLDLVLMEGSA